MLHSIQRFTTINPWFKWLVWLRFKNGYVWKNAFSSHKLVLAQSWKKVSNFKTALTLLQRSEEVYQIDDSFPWTNKYLLISIRLFHQQIICHQNRCQDISTEQVSVYLFDTLPCNFINEWPYIMHFSWNFFIYRLVNHSKCWKRQNSLSEQII